MQQAFGAMDVNGERQKIGINQTVIDMLAKKFKHGDVEERLRVLALVEVSQEHPTLTALLNSALKDKSPRVRAKILDATSRYRPSSLEDLALQLVLDSNGDVRRVAVRTLGSLYSSRSMDALMHALCNDPSHWVRREAIRYITFYDTESVRQAVLSRLEDPHPLVRRRACEYFAEEVQPIPVNEISELVNDEDQWVRFFAIEGLRASGDRRALRGLVSALRHADQSTRERAAKAIGYLGFDEALPHLEYAFSEYAEMSRVLTTAIDRICEMNGISQKKNTEKVDPKEATMIARVPKELHSKEDLEKHRGVVNKLINFLKKF